MFLIFFMSLRLVKYVRIVVYDTGQLFEIIMGSAALPATPQVFTALLFLLLSIAEDSDEDKEELQLLL